MVGTVVAAVAGAGVAVPLRSTAPPWVQRPAHGNSRGRRCDWRRGTGRCRDGSGRHRALRGNGRRQPAITVGEGDDRADQQRNEGGAGYHRSEHPPPPPARWAGVGANDGRRLRGGDSGRRRAGVRANDGRRLPGGHSGLGGCRQSPCRLVQRQTEHSEAGPPRHVHKQDRRQRCSHSGRYRGGQRHEVRGEPLGQQCTDVLFRPHGAERRSTRERLRDRRRQPVDIGRFRGRRASPHVRRDVCRRDGDGVGASSARSRTAVGRRRNRRA